VRWWFHGTPEVHSGLELDRVSLERLRDGVERAHRVLPSEGTPEGQDVDSGSLGGRGEGEPSACPVEAQRAPCEPTACRGCVDQGRGSCLSRGGGATRQPLPRGERVVSRSPRAPGSPGSDGRTLPTKGSPGPNNVRTGGPGGSSTTPGAFREITLGECINPPNPPPLSGDRRRGRPRLRPAPPGLLGPACLVRVLDGLLGALPSPSQ